MDIMHTLACVLPQGDLGIDLTADEEEKNFILTCNDPKGIELQIESKTVMRLEIDYQLSADRTGRWLKVVTSEFSFVPEGKGVPFFRYDFIADPRNVPAAHINVHAERDDFIQALVNRGRSVRAKNRRKAFIEKGVLPRVSNFHFPVGGKRFRPSLEELLGVAIDEFGLDHRDTWKKALDAGQQRHFEYQLKAAVRDDPESAIHSLEQLGYVVTRPEADSTPAP